MEIPADRRTDSSGSLERRLAEVLAFVEGHLRFAEAKNTVSFTAAVAGLVGAMALIGSDRPPDGALLWYLRSFVVCSAVATSVSLLSFAPRIDVPWLRRKGKCSANDDLLYFGDIRKYRPEDYAAAVAALAGVKATEINHWHRLQARQIVINARIASQKFTYFKYSIWFSLGALLTPLIAVVVLVVVHDRDDF
jgi:hypothetical protein